MITVQTTLVMAPGQDEGVLERWQQGQDLHRQSPGFRSARLLRDVDHPERYVIVSEWDTREQAAHYVRTAGWYWVDRAVGLWAEPPTRLHLEVLAVIPSEEQGDGDGRTGAGAGGGP